MKAKKIPSNLEMYEALRNHLKTDNYELVNIQTPLELNKLFGIKNIELSDVLKEAMQSSGNVQGVFMCTVHMSAEEPACEAIGVRYFYNKKRIRFRMAIKTKQFVGGVLECEVSGDGPIVFWPTDPFRLHGKILGMYNLDACEELYGDRWYSDSIIARFIESRVVSSIEEMELYEDLAYGGGSPHMWYEYLQWYSTTTS